MTTFNDEHVKTFLKDKKRLKIPTINEDLERFEKAFEVDKEKVWQ